MTDLVTLGAGRKCRKEYSGSDCDYNYVFRRAIALSCLVLEIELLLGTSNNLRFPKYNKERITLHREFIFNNKEASCKLT